AARERVVAPVDRRRCDKLSPYALDRQSENLGKRRKPHVDKLALAEQRHSVGLGSGVPAGEHRVFGGLLGPPSGYFGVGEQERQVGEIPPAMIGPPLPPEAQQNLDDVAEPDVAAGRRLRASFVGKPDMGKDGDRRGTDGGVALVPDAVGTPRRDRRAARLDRRHGGTQMNRGAVPPAFRREKIDQRAVAAADPPLTTEP